MFVRNNTTCLVCEKSVSYDLYSAGGICSIRGEEVISLCVVCTHCNEIHFGYISSTFFIEAVLRARTYVPATSSWCYWVQTDVSGRLDINDRDWLAFLTSTLHSGFHRHMQDPVLVDNPVLIALCKSIVNKSVNEEYPYMNSEVYLGDLPAGQPLAS